MAKNKKADDLGIDTFMNQVKKNKPTMDKEKVVAISENSKEDNVTETKEELVNMPVDTSKKPADKGSDSTEILFRNVALTPETLYRLETVQTIQNSAAPKGKRVTIAGLMGTIIEEYLDTKYPQTKELYKLMQSIKK